MAAINRTCFCFYNMSLCLRSSVYGGVPEWPKGTDCKSAASCFGGSNPPSSTIEETSFVYQDKRGFFLLSEQNKGRIMEKRALERSIGYSEARFLRSAAKEYRNRCCTNRISLLCKQLLNVFRVWDLNLMFAKNPVQVMI